MRGDTKVIMTCFAGRRRNMDILMRYVDALSRQGSVDEFHIWNFTRNIEDEKWLRDTFGACVTTASYQYQSTPCMLTAGSRIPVRIKGKSDAHIGLIDNNGTLVAEVCLGGWNNSKSVMRAQKQGKLGSEGGGCICRWRMDKN